MIAIDEIRKNLKNAQQFFDLQAEKGANDIRRRMIEAELKSIERCVVELRRRNQQ